jgi:hypothetical protein
MKAVLWEGQHFLKLLLDTALRRIVVHGVKIYMYYLLHVVLYNSILNLVRRTIYLAV